MDMNELARRVKEASIVLASAGTELKNRALAQIARSLQDGREEIIRANREDLLRSEKENLPGPLLKRLKFDEAKIQEVIEGIHSLIELEDPVGRTLLSTELDDGLELYKVTCPIGVIGVIFESRPDALVQISTLCLKSGNGVLLKGGSEARETNRVLAAIIAGATHKAGLPPDWIALLETRSDVGEMLKMDKYIDLIIPRGSNEFVRYIMDNSRIPVLGHADGICHLYVDEDADIQMAVKIAVDAKTQYVAVCNAVETLLVHEKIAPAFLPELKKAMDARQVELIGCPRTRAVIPAAPATEEDWRTEYLDLKLSVKVVAGLDEAIGHINTYGSGHTDGIITRSGEKAARFMDYVDSGNVFWNCSTRFSDGFRYGFGAEVGISTSKVHARGPVGLDGLVIYKYRLIGNGHIVGDYAGRLKTFKHRKMNKDYGIVTK
ncbi:MAG: glutamate-5-semialdehyde dehydrogenase [Pelotomaculum sp.]|uniref:Gamma-glutamyl phosphate reductase n=1 Tax=Pelotomaculum thermopropionicum (strain DSM 13744 / JCM 10971 / SI) TaxID=370438 RepID=PROA_PELTS|nr:RecName: Full=Gamma-glutamyl phosphate reductase; Short=GPR; AltName: Full=Glutamate-5-semialdehyde dehydrogenase; AltName: Full=Glutamyl-gamma-semialdehyde dehydrogenase; Short=GSA dehydrogenase [Pelotomaculum thermopropionicum SI]NPV74579.1 glutamate-5-semialdehyde dehydrogenase [Pelotomaculum sp.]BAF60775.1 gamma-glutamyl phosphate reductase [Pelotomaculum thermopropionicum SI]